MSPALPTPAEHARQAVELEPVAPSSWRDACERAAGSGDRFCGAFATRGESGPEWSAIFARGSGTRVLRTSAAEGADSIVEVIPAADWDEREAHDHYGLGFRGRESLRPLLSHQGELSSWTVPVEGDGVHQVAVGPIHAGVIESGHFRFHVVGERVLHLDTRLFYKHRGLEIAAEGKTAAEGLAYAQRSCGACAVSNSLAYAQACEATMGLAPDRSLRRARTVLAELERVYNHLHDIAAICAGVGFAAGNMAFAALKERALALNEQITGHRFLFDAVRLASNEIELEGPRLDAVREGLRELHTDAAASWRELVFAASFQARLDGIGVLGAAQARRLGTVGPAARASGVLTDTRASSPGLWYESSFPAATLDDPSGDVGARLRIRALELERSLELLDELLGEPLEPGRAGWGGSPAPIGVARVESPRGESVCAVEIDHGLVRRMHLRTASFANWPSLASAVHESLLPDFPLINKSFELCYACVDR